MLFRVNISGVQTLEITADRLVSWLLGSFDGRNSCLLDSCGVGDPGSNLLIAGIDPVEVREISFDDPFESLRAFEKALNDPNLAAFFTISYDCGRKLLPAARTERKPEAEPDIFLALYDSLVIHDYETNLTRFVGNVWKLDQVRRILEIPQRPNSNILSENTATFRSNFTKPAYEAAINSIKELIRSGETYQTNLTQQISVEMPPERTAATVFTRLRKSHPAQFAAYMDRGISKVVSASPERFLRISEEKNGSRTIVASPIKGTRRRGTTKQEDDRLSKELLSSDKDRAENTMIVDLMRNDLGRVCKFGSVAVDGICKLETHPTLFHLVSQVSGTLRDDATLSEIIWSTFPSGSITGAPKIRTMNIIENIETESRGLSMGAIGYRIPGYRFGLRPQIEMSVAIRTMVIRNATAIFNAGGGIVIDSDPASEFDESMLKAQALLNALGSDISNRLA